MANTIISPSILAANFLNLEAELKAFGPVEDFWFHLDIMDGHFVPNLTFGTPIVEKIQMATKKPLDAHFMVNNPELYIELFKNSKIHNFTFHWELDINHLEMIEKIKEFYPSVGISINPETNVEDLPVEIFDVIDLILVMTVRPGFGGQTFIQDCMDKVKALDEIRRKNNYNFQIQVDGGVNNLNAKKLIFYGADNLVAGSYIFKNKPSEYIQKVESLRDFKE